MRLVGPNNQKNLIHARLKAARKNAHLSQQDLAARLQTRDIHVDQKMVSKIEANRRIVTDYELMGICAALHMTPAELLADAEKLMEPKENE